MELILFALFLLLALGLLFGIAALNKQLAYDKKHRYCHIRHVFTLALVLLIATNVYTTSWFIRVADSIINNPKLAGFFDTVLPHRAYGLLYMLLMLLLLNWLVAALSLVVSLVLAYIPGRREYLQYSDCTGFGKVLHFPWLIVNAFYDDAGGEIRLQPRGFSLGKWVKGFETGFGILTVAQFLVLAVSVLWGSEDWNKTLLAMSQSWYLLPMACYCWLQQVRLFFDGEFYDEVGGFSSARITTGVRAEVEKLMQLYRHYFKGVGALLLSDFHVEKKNTTGLQGNRLGNRQIHDCKNNDVLEVVVNQIKQSDFHMNDSYKNALVELLNGNSINVCDHCEGEFLLYLCAYLNFFISQGKTALVLCPSAKRVRQVKTAIEQAMNRLNNLCSVWNVSTLEDTKDPCRVNVLVCTAEEFVQGNVVDRRKEFAADCFCTVLCDGFALFSRDCIRTNRLFGTLRAMQGMDQYILFTEGNNDNLRTAVEKVTQKELLPFCNNALCPGTGIMVWREESAYRIQRKLGVGNPLSPYMGTALPLAVLAAKFDVDKIHLVEDPTRADHSYWDVLSMTGGELAHFMQKSANLQSMIRTDNSEILGDNGEKIIIAYDTEYNFYHALWRWVKYGGAGNTMIHVIAPSYLLRGYFADNYHKGKMLLRNNDFDPLISYSQGMDLTRMAVLLVTLGKEAVSERVLLQTSREYGWQFENAVDLLQACLRVVLTEAELHSVYSSFRFTREKEFDPTTGSFRQETFVRLVDEVIKNRLEQKTVQVGLVYQNKATRLPVLLGNVYNYYLRGQVVPIGGHFYQISMIGNGNVYAEQKLHSSAPEYLQLSDFRFDNYRQIDECVDIGALDINICTADVYRNIYGYWETVCGNRFAEGSGPVRHDLRGENLSVEYRNASILEIHVARSALGPRPVETVRLFAYVLKELFKTLFPYSHQNLFTAVRETDCGNYARQVFESGDHSLEAMAASLIPSVAEGFDTPKADAVTLYVVEASCLEFGMVQMLYKRRGDVFRMLREYLRWYQATCLEPAQEEAAPAEEMPLAGDRYLHFGSDRIPEVFCLEGLLQLIETLAPDTAPIQVEVEEELPQEGLRHCSFCGAPTMMPIELNEGRFSRIMCRECHEHQCTAEDEIKVLYQSVFGSMERGYHITLPKNLMVRFQTAEAIRKFTGVGGDGGRVLGFYYHAGRQLWLEARGPEVALRSTMFHELTHAWQHSDSRFDAALDRALRKFKRKHRKLVRLLLVEGHAMYVEIDGMWEHHELVYADRMRQSTEKRADEYGLGYVFVREYLDEYRNEGSYVTPFVAMQQLVENIAAGETPFAHLEKIITLLTEGG